jgi:adenylate kinase family enzyme
LKSYLIDGFPRAQDQAEYFEKVVGPPDSVLYFNASEEICTKRCLERAKTSGRVDDTEEIIIKRLRTYNEMSKPVVELYKGKNKVDEIDGGKDLHEVWEATKKAVTPL